MFIKEGLKDNINANGEELMLEEGSTCKAYETDFMFFGLHVPCFSNMEVLTYISKYICELL